MGDLTSSRFDFGASTLGAGSLSAMASMGSVGVRRATGAANKAGMATGEEICTAPRCCGVLEMRIFIPLSDEISTESTDEPSSISISFLT